MCTKLLSLQNVVGMYWEGPQKAIRNKSTTKIRKNLTGMPPCISDEQSKNFFIEKSEAHSSYQPIDPNLKEAIR